MTFELTKDIAEKIMAEKGEVRGTVFITDKKFIVMKGGDESLKEVEMEIQEVTGKEFRYSDIEPANFYPTGLRIISLLATAKILKMNDDDVREMGSSAPKVSMTVRLFARYFLSLDKTFEQVATIWLRHYTRGELEPFDMDKKERFFILKLNNFRGHPIFCTYLSGYFSRIAEMVIKENIKIEETECALKNNKSHSFKVTW